MSQLKAIGVPVADLRSQPIPAVYSFNQDLNQESQLLYGEQVLVKEEQNGWVYIEALEQPRFRESTGWTGYPGWVREDQTIELEEIPAYNLAVCNPWVTIKSSIPFQVSMGTFLEGIEELEEGWLVRLLNQQEGFISKKDVETFSCAGKDLRAHLLNLGKKLLGFPYLWGGRSAFRPECRSVLTSCDCSGLVNLTHRVLGIEIPRDAHDQFLKSQKKEFHELQCADLIFLAKAEKPQRMNHVMFFAGGDDLLDTNITDQKAILTTAQERFGRKFATMRNGENIGKYIIYFGDILFGKNRQFY